MSGAVWDRACFSAAPSCSGKLFGNESACKRPSSAHSPHLSAQSESLFQQVSLSAHHRLLFPLCSFLKHLFIWRLQKLRDWQPVTVSVFIRFYKHQYSPPFFFNRGAGERSEEWEGSNVPSRMMCRAASREAAGRLDGDPSRRVDQFPF